jgi:Ca-activated chloride channel family protein
VQFSASRAAVVGSANHRVQADYAANVLAVAKDEAVALVDANRRDQAAAVLRQKAAELKVMGETYGNARVGALAAPAAPEADRIERDGLDNAGRKIYRAESMQTRSQQSLAP